MELKSWLGQAGDYGIRDIQCPFCSNMHLSTFPLRSPLAWKLICSAYSAGLIPVCQDEWLMCKSDIILRQPMKMVEDQHTEEDAGEGQMEER